MKIYEIKGFGGLVSFILASTALLSVAILIPVSITWITWNAIVSDLFRGPLISFWQASVLFAIVAVTFKIVAQPQISFQFKRVKPQDEPKKPLGKLKDQDPHHGA